ncbi:SIS domain-containing protein [Candidatus Poribacteria bacterium]|nr:SIS domain-containing protein [Candidatus Poribacteria bacterium]
MTTVEHYLRRRAERTTAIARRVDGCVTAREIVQQPWTWMRTAELLSDAAPEDLRDLSGLKTIVFCGAGTSDYVGRTVAPAVRYRRGIPAYACATTDIIAEPDRALPIRRPALMVHFARSGNSPESCETLRVALSEDTDAIRHWIVTCNPDGQLAQLALRHPRSYSLTVLPPETHDQGLAMTSSYTNMVLAGYWLADPDGLMSLTAKLARCAEDLIDTESDRISDAVGGSLERAFYLGTGGLHAAATESALKMQELTRGTVMTQSETFLGFRHGPIAALSERALVVAFLSASTSHARRYERDLLAQVADTPRILVGEDCDAPSVPTDTIVSPHGYSDVPDEFRAPIAVVVGQMLGVFRAIALGIDPDDPAGPNGSYSRVVQGVTIHPHVEADGSGMPGDRE